jgi:hypothetical protein
MNIFLRRWLTVSFFNLMLVALLGVILRYKIAFYLPFVQQKFLLHSHSHFAFSGWITQTLMILLIHYLAQKKGDEIIKRYRWLLYSNCITAYGMLVSFIFQGYAFFSISFSTLSIVVSYLFAIYYWKDLGRLKEKAVCHYWFKAALVFSALSSLGAFSLAYMMANKIMVQNLYLAAIYFFLHFQYNGWFFFAGMGLLVSRLQSIPGIVNILKRVFWLFCLACLPAYFLSALWLPFPFMVYCIVVMAVVAQLAAWAIMIRLFVTQQVWIKQQFSKQGRALLLLAAIAFTIKLLLQTGSVHPALSQLSYGFRPIVIGYLHLVLLAVTSIFILGYIASLNMVYWSSIFRWGIIIFVSGIIINELLLMVQGVAALTYAPVEGINILLLVAAVILCTGISVMFASQLKSAKAGIIK